MSNDTLQILDKEISALKDRMKEVEKLRSAEWEKVQNSQNLDRWRAVVYQIEGSGVRTIEEIYEHSDLNQLMKMLDLFQFHDAKWNNYRRLEIYPLFSND